RQWTGPHPRRLYAKGRPESLVGGEHPDLVPGDGLTASRGYDGSGNRGALGRERHDDVVDRAAVADVDRYVEMFAPVVLHGLDRPEARHTLAQKVGARQHARDRKRT